MKFFVARVVAFVSRALFLVFRLFPQQQKIVFMSRQGHVPLDFSLLEPVLQKELPGYNTVWLCVSQIGGLGPGLYVRQLWHAATAALCIVDGYVPAVCVCAGLHRAKCMQLWHALGAIKKFGKQMLNTPAGHSGAIARILRMHEGYDVVVAGFAGAVPAFAQAFGYNEAAFRPLGLPRFDYLAQGCADSVAGVVAAQGGAVGKLAAALPKGCKVVLYAPTFRKGNAYPKDWMQQNVCALRDALPAGVVLLVAGHPLQAREGGGMQAARECVGLQNIIYLGDTPTIDAYPLAQAVITDYSAVAFEAYAAHKPVFFYVPDIKEYRCSPGLNIDPLLQFPDVSFDCVAPLAAAVSRSLGGEDVAPASAFSAFMKDYARGCTPGAATRIALLAKKLVS